MKGRIGDVVRWVLSLVFIVGVLWAVLAVDAKGDSDEAYPVADAAYPIEYASPNPNPIVPTLIAASETRQARPTRRWVTVTGWWETPEPEIEAEAALEPAPREKEEKPSDGTTAKLPPEPTPDPTPTPLPTPEPTPEPTAVIESGPTEVEMNHLMLWGQR